MLQEGSEIKGYRIERLLGRGGMGEVYEATQLGLGRRVALKVVRTGLGPDEGFRERFRREGQLQATLEHPNVVTVYEAGELDGDLFLAMRLVEGVTLKQLIVEGELDAERSLRILAPIADALDVAHAGGLVHRDVKPQNILVGNGDHPFLADFGLTRGRDQSALTRSGQVVGTIDYIAPELVRGEPAVSASDVYSFGGVLYECMTGSVPYPLPTDAAVLYAHLHEPPPSAKAIRDDFPPGLDSVLAQGMAKEPEERPASAGELVAAAYSEAGGGAIGASRPPRRDPLAHGVRSVSDDTAGSAASATTASLARPRRGRIALLGGLGLIAVALLAFIVGRALGDHGDPKLSTGVSSGTVSLRAPGGWAPTSGGERPRVPGLDLRGAVGVAAGGRSASGVEAGMSDASGALLLPTALVERAVGGLPPARPVTLGKLEALRYRNVDLRGFGGDLTLYASPSTQGVATVACYSPRSDTAFATPCESVAQTLELTSARPFPLEVPARTERALDRTIATLDRERRAGRRDLAKATTNDRQAAAAHRLARAYGEAGRRLDRLQVSPVLAGPVDAASSGADASREAYEALADAARSEDAQAFDAAEGSVEASEARVEDALAAIGQDQAPSGSR